MHVKSVFTAVCLLLGIFMITENATAYTFALPIEHWTSKKGVPVYLVTKTQVPIIHIAVVFDAGSAHDNNLPGTAVLITQMLHQGTCNQDANDIAERFESVGAQYSSMISKDMTAIQFRSLSEPSFFSAALNTFSELIAHANFPEKALHREKKQVKITLQQEQQSPATIAMNAFYKQVYGKHSYAFSVLGTAQGVDHITRTQLINFYRRYYVAQNARIVIVGNITKDEAVHAADQLSSALPQGEQAKPLARPLVQSNNNSYKIDYPAQQSTLILGQTLGITLKDPDYFPLLVGNQILGGGILTSRLFTEVRNKRGLCYGINSHLINLRAGGPFAIMLQTRNSQVGTALAVVQNTLKQFIENGPSEQELNATKQALIGSFPLSVADNEAILGKLVEMSFYELPLNYWDDYLNKINQVTLQQVRDAFKKRIKMEKLLIVTVGGH